MDLIKYETTFNTRFELLRKKITTNPSIQLFIVIFTKKNNNIFITVTNLFHKILFKISSGSEGFKNSIKSTPFILQYVCQNLVRRLLRLKFTKIIIKFKNMSNHYRHFLRILKAPTKYFNEVELLDMNINISLLQIILIPKIPFGGCKLRKQKRR